jgi:RNA polymerase sigma-70 factor, ECF subfamily
MKDHGDFDAFYLGSRTRLVHQLYAMTGDLGAAQDAAQEAYARAWQRWGKLQSYDDPEAWVRTVAWRLVVSRWRKTRNALAAHVRHGADASSPEPSTDTVLLVTALRKLPESQRRAIVLHHLCDLSVEDVARETGAPIGTVKARLSRGRTALGALLGETTTDGTTNTEGSHV